MRPYSILLHCLLLGLLCISTAPLPAETQPSRDPAQTAADRWSPYFNTGQWQISANLLSSRGPEEESARLAAGPATTDVLAETDVCLGDSVRTNFGLVLRATPDRSCLVVRYYDRNDTLELLRYDRGQVRVVASANSRLGVKPGIWYHLKTAAISQTLLAKLWETGAKEPRWQLHVQLPDATSGQVGLMAQDGSHIDFRNPRIAPASDIQDLRTELADEQQNRLRRLREALTLELEPTPFVLKRPEGPMRRVELRFMLDGKPEPLAGSLSVRCGPFNATRALNVSDLAKGPYALLLPEPNVTTDLSVTFDTSLNTRLEKRLSLSPARHWTFYMTPHTHYDIGFTHPQPNVINRLSADMDSAVAFCRQTADWPPESRYRWTVEVTGLVKNYIDRHTPEQVAGLMELARQNRIEVCGYYLNMPTELLGHEELIRCLYYARELKDRFGISIDTAMINDVPGYAWALPQLFQEAGISRVSFRANSIRGQFLWYRPGAIERPFYWQGPEGSKIFFWYTDSYREGNFFREPGLHEDAFRSIIQQNERAGTRVDHIQLRMGGDNLPPDLDTSTNTRAWNQTYVWPRIVVATNREFLQVIEDTYGPQSKTFAGDIPSWWAEGPASSSFETGMNRIVHDRLVAAEALWTLLWLGSPDITYPHQKIANAYDKMLHYDEHTWGASESISNPRSKVTQGQWKWKADTAYDARKLTEELYTAALEQLSRPRVAADASTLAVWNTLAWPRTDTVELRLEGTPLAGAKAISVVDTRDQQPLPAQIGCDGKSAVFVARNLPALGSVRYSVRTATEPTSTGSPNSDQIENRFHRLTVSPRDGGITSWYDKTLQREMLDANAPYKGNQAIYETPIGKREVIDQKKPVAFNRVAALNGKRLRRVQGAVYDELVIETALPTCPRIEQAIRLYHELPVVDVVNIVDKQEVYEPEILYFAFPFSVPAPEIRLQIADAVMRPGKDQLTYTCHDFYSIQHWADIAGDGFGIVLAPLEAPLLSVSDLNAYKWADRITFDKGHLYSMVMNNCWTTNFKAGQGGKIPFRYRLFSYAGRHDPVASTHKAWQPFFPLSPVWLQSATSPAPSVSEPLLKLEGDPVIVSCIKKAETTDALVIRLLEQRGAPARCTLRFALPGHRRIAKAFSATAVEIPRQPLTVKDDAVTVELRANQIATLLVVPQP